MSAITLPGVQLEISSLPTAITCSISTGRVYGRPSPVSWLGMEENATILTSGCLYSVSTTADDIVSSTHLWLVIGSVTTRRGAENPACCPFPSFMIAYVLCVLPPRFARLDLSHGIMAINSRRLVVYEGCIRIGFAVPLYRARDAGVLYLSNSVFLVI